MFNNFILLKAAKLILIYIKKYIKVYMDASKNISNKIGVASVVPEFNIQSNKQISDGLSVYMEEIGAFFLAVQWLEEVRPVKP